MWTKTNQKKKDIFYVIFLFGCLTVVMSCRGLIPVYINNHLKCIDMCYEVNFFFLSEEGKRFQRKKKLRKKKFFSGDGEKSMVWTLVNISLLGQS